MRSAPRPREKLKKAGGSIELVAGKVYAARNSAKVLAKNLNPAKGKAQASTPARRLTFIGSATPRPHYAFGIRQFVLRYRKLRQRIIFTLCVVVVVRIGAAIPCPGINTEILARFFHSVIGRDPNNTVVGLFNLFSGGAL